MFGHGAFDISRSFRNETDNTLEYLKETYSCFEQTSNEEAACRAKAEETPGCTVSMEALNECYCECKDNPDVRYFGYEGDAGWSPSTENSTSYDNSNGNGDADEGEEELQCDSADCPPNHVATKKTDANGKESCECVDAQAVGDGIKAIGTGLALLAVGGVVTTGLIGYAIYRIIRG
tara:strand:- start:8015 stop:8545 length:531 start_codon:yes stop_codon:yes gene_type:complete